MPRRHSGSRRSRSGGTEAAALPNILASDIEHDPFRIFTYEYGLFPLRKGGAAIEQFVAVEDYGDLTSTPLDLVEWRARPPKNEL